MAPPNGWKGPIGQDGLVPAPVGPATGKLERFDAGGKLIKR